MDAPAKLTTCPTTFGFPETKGIPGSLLVSDFTAIGSSKVAMGLPLLFLAEMSRRPERSRNEHQ